MRYFKTALPGIAAIVAGIVLDRFFGISWQMFLLFTAGIACIILTNRVDDLRSEISFLRERLEFLEDKFK